MTGRTQSKTDADWPAFWLGFAGGFVAAIPLLLILCRLLASAQHLIVRI